MAGFVQACTLPNEFYLSKCLRRLDAAEVTMVTSLYVFTLLVVKQVEKSK